MTRIEMRSLSGLSGNRGLSLVEMLIGLALGLLIVAAASSLLASQLQENRSLTLEARLQQDLRTAADLVTRDLRRAGYWGHAAAGVWTTGSALGLPQNPYAAPRFAVAASDAVDLRYSRDTLENDMLDRNEQFGYRLRNGAIEVELGLDNWQALTDSTTLTIVGFTLTPTAQDIDLSGTCSLPCPAAGTPTCPTRQQVRSFVLEITARAVSDTRVVRRLRSEVRLRNDSVTGACPHA